MDRELITCAIEGNNVPTSQVLTDSLRLSIDSEYTGCCRIVFTLQTRHYLTSVSLNERISHRYDLNWIVYSIGRDKILGVITQNEASYQHPDCYVNLPEDRDLIIIPSDPYISNHCIAVDCQAYQVNHTRHAFRYEIQIGSSFDDAFIGDRWSYREGRLCFGHWFHNKAFRWAFNGAEIKIPTQPGNPCCILFNIFATTDFQVIVGGEVVGNFSRTMGGTRWHNDDYRVEIPEHLIASDITTIRFCFSGSSWDNIDFNLRQEGLALSRVVVDTFEGDCKDFAKRISAFAWSERRSQESQGFYAFNNHLFDSDLYADVVPQALIAIDDSEGEILNVYHAPHDQFWISLHGIWLSLLRAGVSASVRPMGNVGLARSSESVIIGPLRYNKSAISKASDLLKDWPSSKRGILFSHGIPSLRLAGLPLDNDLLGSITYRELYNAQIVQNRTSNYWEMIITRDNYWESCELFIHENGLIGKPRDCEGLLLASASPAEWIEMGDPDAYLVIERFVSMITGDAPIRLRHMPGAIAFQKGNALLACYDRRAFADSHGSGIARGWPENTGEFSVVPTILAQADFISRGMPTSDFSNLVDAFASQSNEITMRLSGGINCFVATPAFTRGE